MSGEAVLQVIYRDPRDLTPYKGNARTHSPEQIAQIAASIREFGFASPILLKDDETQIGAGHARREAALLLGLTSVPTITLRGLSESKWRAFVLADNKLALNAGWDEDVLRAELEALASEDFGLQLTGFEQDELDALLAPSATQAQTDPDDAPEAPEATTSILGDVWILGGHRVMCGDSLSMDQVQRLTGGVIPDLANCDPPYGISVVKGASVGGAEAFGKVGGGNAPYGGWKDGDRTKGPARQGREHGPAKNAIIKPGTYAPIIGDDTIDTAVASYGVLTALGVPIIALWGGNYFANALPNSRCWLIWDKENTGTFADAELAWTNQDKVVKLIRHQWSGLIKASERGERRVHPTQKPVALAEWVMEALAPKALTVIDLFLGSASTLIAAERRGMKCFGMEMSPAYVDVAVTRWQAFTGKTATLEATGQTFQEVQDERRRQAAA